MATERLTVDELRELSSRARAGDLMARNAIVEAYIDLPFMVAVGGGLARRLPVRRKRRVDSEDMLQEGALAMMRAASGWRDGREANFQTYAGKVVYRAMRRWLDRKGDRKLGRVVPLDDGKRVDDEGEETDLQVADPSAADPLALMIGGEEEDRLVAAFNGLGARDRELLIRRHGLDGKPPRCDEALAYWMGTTPTAMRRAAVELERKLADAVA